LDLPSKYGELQADVIARWAANAPLAMIDQYVASLKKLTAIGIDVGEQDVLLASNTEFSRVLSLNGIPHTFEAYNGDHTNRMAVRVETRVLPFFSSKLSFAATKQVGRKRFAAGQTAIR
jgi:hypothetical protein